MGEAKLYGQNKGGASINGVIKDYYAYAGENISAGDLVEYVNGIASQTTETSEDIRINAEEDTGRVISAVKLDETRVFIAYYSNSSYYYLYGMILTVDGVIIKPGQSKKLSSTKYTGEVISAVKLDANKVFIAHSYSQNDYYLYGMVCTVSGETITAGTDTSISTSTYSGYKISAVALSSNKVFIAHNDNSSSHYLSGIVCNINGTSITKGKATIISNKENTSVCMSPIALSDNKVFIAYYRLTSYDYLEGIVITIDGTTISKGESITIENCYSTGANQISTQILPNGNVFVAYDYSSTLGVSICSVTGTTVKVVKSKNNLSRVDESENVSATVLDDGNVLVLYGRQTGTLYGKVISIADTAISAFEFVKLYTEDYTAYSIASLALQGGKIFIAHCSDDNYYLDAQIWGVSNNIPTSQISIPEYETQVRKVTAGQFDGVAKTEGIGGDNTSHNDMVSIWTLVPVVTEEFTMADGNTMCDANGDVFLVREE